MLKTIWNKIRNRRKLLANGDGTFTVPDGATHVEVSVVGGGGKKTSVTGGSAEEKPKEEIVNKKYSKA